MPSLGVTRRSTPDGKAEDASSLTDAFAPVQQLHFAEAAEKVKTWADSHGTGSSQGITTLEQSLTREGCPPQGAPFAGATN